MNTEEKYNNILRHLKIDNSKVAEWFGYKNAGSFANSSARPRIIQGVVRLYECIGANLLEFFDSLTDCR